MANDQCLCLRGPLVEFPGHVYDRFQVGEDAAIEHIPDRCFEPVKLALCEAVADWLALVPPDGSQGTVADCRRVVDGVALVFQAEPVSAIGGHPVVAVDDVACVVALVVQQVSDDLVERPVEPARFDIDLRRRAVVSVEDATGRSV